ncbi:MAG TPA: DUF5134 domain-containing protein [Pseudonocardiaceae bacterium]|nr:DUF5134 domain-containing protein [Pseudonocardiaceae bacterium]
MTTPLLLRWVFIPALLVFSVPAIGRLVALRASTDRPADIPDWHEDLAQLVMGGAMIAMLLSRTNLVPKPVWLVAFGIQAIAFGAQLLGLSSKNCGCANWPRVHHLMAGLAMAYALTGTMELPALAGSFGMYFIGYTGWAGYRLVRARAVAVAGPGGLVLWQPQVVEIGRVVMGLGMAYMMLSAAM